MSTFRPELHVTADSGILEGPAGVIFDGREGENNWHIFYQYRPTPEAPSRWGHNVSDGDPFSWVECNDAIVPAGGESAVRAGAVIGAPEGIYLYFTSATAAGNTIQLAHAPELEGLCDELLEDTNATPGVQRLGDIVEDTPEYNNFRSPCVVPDWKDDEREEHDGWLMLAITGSVDTPKPVVLRSIDGVEWRFEGPLTFDGDPGIDLDETLVAPRICRLRDEVDSKIYDVFFFTLERGGKDRSAYIIGKLENNTFRVTTPAQALDFGHDFTRPRNTNYLPVAMDPAQRYQGTYLFGFMTPSGRQGSPTKEPNWETEGWANTLTLPRYVTLQDGHLYQVPAPGLPEAVSTTRGAHLWTALCEISAGGSVVAEIVDGNGEVAARVSHAGDKLTVDRFDGQVAEAEIGEDEEDTITVIVDGSTLEVYADGGAVVMSSRIWPENGCIGIRSRAKGDASILNEWRRSR